MNMETKALKDPRTWDWSRIANFARGWLEYLVEYNNDGSIRGMLLESWDRQRRRHRIHPEGAQGREMEQRRRLHRR
jgi:hypothetical protein